LYTGRWRGDQVYSCTVLSMVTDLGADDLKLERAYVRGKKLRRRRVDHERSHAVASACAVTSGIAGLAASGRPHRPARAGARTQMPADSADVRFYVRAMHSRSRTRTRYIPKLSGCSRTLLEVEVGFSDDFIGDLSNLSDPEVDFISTKHCSPSYWHASKSSCFQASSVDTAAIQWPALMSRPDAKGLALQWPCCSKFMPPAQANHTAECEVFEQNLSTLSLAHDDDHDVEDDWEIVPETFVIHLRGSPPRMRL